MSQWTDRIIPACAGSTARSASSWTALWDHPRLRGEHAESTSALETVTGSSPPARGALEDSVGEGFAHLRGDHPRLRGEHGQLAHGGALAEGSSPPARGAQHTLFEYGQGIRIIPACAGSTGGTKPSGITYEDHPRLRGEHQAYTDQTLVNDGSSPPARGAPWCSWTYRCGAGIIPACAGSTAAPASRGRRSADHPRLRGEHRAAGVLIRWGSGSSPPARGALPAQRRPPPQDRIIPACAGSTSRPRKPRRHLSDHPRLRGEHPRLFRPDRLTGGSSPPARGARPVGNLRGREHGIIPACAGSTRSHQFPSPLRADHPRLGYHADREPVFRWSVSHCSGWG